MIKKLKTETKTETKLNTNAERAMERERLVGKANKVKEEQRRHDLIN